MVEHPPHVVGHGEHDHFNFGLFNCFRFFFNFSVLLNSIRKDTEGDKMSFWDWKSRVLQSDFIRKWNHPWTQKVIILEYSCLLNNNNNN